MHDLDNPQRELDELEFDEYEDEFDEYEYEYEYDGAEHEEEVDELELAAELLEITDEAELEEFLGSLLSKVGGLARKAVSSPTGKALVGVLRDSAKTALPQLGAVLGSAVVPGQTGKRFGAATGRRLGAALGLELEGLSDEDAEFEVAKTFIRFARSAGRNAALTGSGEPPKQAAKRAAVKAARRHAPPLAALIARRPVRPAQTIVSVGRGRRSGRWIRRGNSIVLIGV